MSFNKHAESNGRSKTRTDRFYTRSVVEWKVHSQINLSSDVRRGSPDSAETADRRSPLPFSTRTLENRFFVVDEATSPVFVESRISRDGTRCLVHYKRRFELSASLPLQEPNGPITCQQVSEEAIPIGYALGGGLPLSVPIRFRSTSTEFVLLLLDRLV